MRIRTLPATLAALIVLALVACQTTTEPEEVTITIDPAEAAVMLNHQHAFTATVVGTSDTGVTWSTNGGTISGSGSTITYIAPSHLGDYELRATSTADPAAHADASVHVVAYPGQVWASQYGSKAWEYINAVAVDSEDNIVIAGATDGELFPGSKGGRDIFVAKFAADGTPLWAYQYGTAESDSALALAIDSTDHVLLAGSTWGNLFAAHAGTGDAFIVKLAPSGAPIWGVQHGTPHAEEAYAVATDSADNVILGGLTTGALFAPQQGSYDAFAVKMTPDAAPVWAYQVGTPSSDYMHSLAVDSTDTVVLAGSTRGDLFGTNQGGWDGFLAKVTATGTPLGGVQYGSTDSDFVEDMALDSNDAVLLAGRTYGDQFGPHLGAEDAFVTKVAADGTLLWAVQHGTSGDDGIHALAVDSMDNVLMGGQSEGDLFGESTGSSDAVFAKIGPLMEPIRNDQFGSTNADRITAVAFDSADRIILAGTTLGDVAGSNQGGRDVFIIVLEAPAP